MNKRIVIGNVADVPPGEGRTYEVAGRQLAVFHTRSGTVYATQARCPHLGGPLADGLVGGTTVICPLHDRIFDLRTGDGPDAGCAITIYPVARSTDGTIAVEITE